MPWFVIQCERKTWTKYLVEADSEEAALQASDDWRYLGYLDGDVTGCRSVGGGFESDVEALADLSSYVEG